MDKTKLYIAGGVVGLGSLLFLVNKGKDGINTTSGLATMDTHNDTVYIPTSSYDVKINNGSIENNTNAGKSTAEVKQSLEEVAKDGGHAMGLARKEADAIGVKLDNVDYTQINVDGSVVYKEAYGRYLQTFLEDGKVDGNDAWAKVQAEQYGIALRYQ